MIGILRFNFATVITQVENLKLTKDILVYKIRSLRVSEEIKKY